MAKLVLGILAVLITASYAWAASSDGWTTLRNERFGFRLEYPTDLFQPVGSSQAGDAMVLASGDGSARLLVGAFVNDARHTPASYQRYLARQTSASFPASYAPRGATWFVLSGEGGGKIVYEKVRFSCGNGVITSFAMIYPTAQRRRFDAVVERIENSFQAGPGCK